MVSRGAEAVLSAAGSGAPTVFDVEAETADDGKRNGNGAAEGGDCSEAGDVLLRLRLTRCVCEYNAVSRLDFIGLKMMLAAFW